MECMKFVFSKQKFVLIIDEDGYNDWQELLKFLFDCCNSPRAEMKESALYILW